MELTSATYEVVATYKTAIWGRGAGVIWGRGRA